MSGILTFPVDDTLKAIVEHARNAPARSPNYNELYDPECRKDGKEPDDGVFATIDDVDPDKIPHGLWIVKDDGVYLMSPGNPPLLEPGETRNVVAYALEAPNTPDGLDAARAIMGGDDGVDKLDLAFFEKAIASGYSTVVVTVTPTSLSLTARP